MPLRSLELSYNIKYNISILSVYIIYIYAICRLPDKQFSEDKIWNDQIALAYIKKLFATSQNPPFLNMFILKDIYYYL